MKQIILGVLAVIVIVTTLALCEAAREEDESLEHPERITLKGDK
jgi:glucose uptake protein GlcU